MAYEKINWLNKGEEGAKPINKTNLNHMDDGISELDKNKIDKTVIELLTVSDTKPASCIAGDMYYDTTQNKIFTATGENTWEETGSEPLSVYLYVDLQNENLYYYDGTTFKSYGGGSNGGGTGGGTFFDAFPIGAMIPYGNETAPANWLICDGSEVSRSTYSDLFAVIGTSYGEGDGSTTFNLPNKKGKVSVGLDSNDETFNALGNTGGEKEHQLTIEEMPEHYHNLNVAIVGTTSKFGDGYIPMGNSYDLNSNYITHNKGGSEAHNNLQPYEVDQWIIKAYQTTGVLAETVPVEQDLTSESTEAVPSVKAVSDALAEIGAGGGTGRGVTLDTFPIGAMIPYGSVTPPANWLICDGSEVSRTTYADLFNVIGTSYGEGDGETTFNLPNKKGRVSVGLDSEDETFNAIGNVGGEKEHQLTIEEMPIHNHKIYLTYNKSSSEFATIAPNGSSTDLRDNFMENAGGDQPHNNLQPYEVDNWVIKAFQSTGILAEQVPVVQSLGGYNMNAVPSVFAINNALAKIDGRTADLLYFNTTTISNKQDQKATVTLDISYAEYDEVIAFLKGDWNHILPVRIIKEQFDGWMVNYHLASTTSYYSMGRISVNNGNQLTVTISAGGGWAGIDLLQIYGIKYSGISTGGGTGGNISLEHDLTSNTTEAAPSVYAVNNALKDYVTTTNLNNKGYVAGTGITKIITLTQNEYDALATKESTALYLITG